MYHNRGWECRWGEDLQYVRIATRYNRFFLPLFLFILFFFFSPIFFFQFLPLTRTYGIGCSGRLCLLFVSFLYYLRPSNTNYPSCKMFPSFSAVMFFCCCSLIHSLTPRCSRCVPAMNLVPYFLLSCFCDFIYGQFFGKFSANLWFWWK